MIMGDDSGSNGNGKRGISARICPELYRKTRIYVIEHGMSYEEWIERAMERYYAECTGGLDESVMNEEQMEKANDIF